MNRPWRELVTGSRGWVDLWALRDVLNLQAQQAADAGATELIVVHGACYPPKDPNGQMPWKSADWLAHRWVIDLPHPLPVREEPHPANWSAPCRPECRHGGRRQNKRGTGTYCPTAGNYRNGDMVAIGADHASVFQLNGSTGTEDCWKRIKAARIPFTPVIRRSSNLPAPAGADRSPTA